MSGYIPQVGDRARRADWRPDEWTDIAYVGQVWTIGLDQSGEEQAIEVEGEWHKVEPPTVYPERWWVIFPQGVSLALVNSLAASQVFANDPPRIGVLHLHPDGTTTMGKP